MDLCISELQQEWPECFEHNAPFNFCLSSNCDFQVCTSICCLDFVPYWHKTCGIFDIVHYLFVTMFNILAQHHSSW